MKSIKNKILAIVILALVATSVSIGAVSHFLTHRIIHEDADAMLTAVSREKAANVNAILKNMESAVNMIHAYIDQRLETPEQLRDPTFYNEITSDVESLFGDIAQITEGIVGYYFRYAPELTNSTAGFFYNKNAETDTFYKIASTDISKYDPSDISHVGWYYEPIRARQPIWMDPFYNENNNMKMISYVIPIYKDTTLIGVVGMNMDFVFLTKSIDSISIYQEGFAYLSSANGTLLHSPYALENYDEDSIGQFSEASAKLENGMSLTVRAAYRDIQKSSRSILQSILLITLILSALFIVITTVVTNRIISPLRLLTEQAKKLADGKEKVEIVSNSKDEVGALSRIFYETAEKLQSHMSYINALAYRDSLTGVKNRAAYSEAVNEMEKQMCCACPEYGVLVADINDLKHINDTFGHDAGNQLITHAAKTLSETFRFSPIFRIGGDEFLVILTGSDLEQYRQRIKQFDETCKTECIVIDGKETKLSIARGVALYNPNIDQTFNDVFQHADQAMYMHKQTTKKQHSAL